MGLFSDRCEALVDKETGEALTGNALREAQKDPKWPRCGHRVPKKAVQCSKCLSPAPGGWFRCSACGKWIGNDSKGCPHCGVRFHPDTRVDMAGGIWSKQGDLFAQRFEVGDVARLLKAQDLQVQEGTVALLLDGGKYVKHLEAGRHNPASLARTINWFGNPPPRTMIMVDAGDVRLPLEITGLRSAEKIPLDFGGDVVLRFDPKHADAFIANALKGAREISYDKMAELLAGDIRSVVEAFCATTKMDDLAFDPERRKRLTVKLQDELKISCERLGVEIVYVAAADFMGAGYKALIDANGQLELKRREIEYAQAVRELLSRDRMHEFKTESDLKTHLAALAQEFRMGEHQRQREESQLLRGWQRQDELDDLRHQIEKNTIELDDALKTERARHQLKIDAAIADITIKAKEFDQQMREASAALELREKKNEIKNKDQKAKGELIAGKTIEDRLQLEQDPVVRDQLLELQRIRANQQAGLAEAALKAAQEREKQLIKWIEDKDKDREISYRHAENIARILADGKNGGTTNIVK